MFDHLHDILLLCTTVEASDIPGKKIIGVIQRTHGDTKDSHNKSPNNRNWQDMGIHNRQADV
jgi:hypothetical protein